MRIVLSVVLLLAQEDASKELLKGWKHPWEGATVGTWIKMRVTSSRGANDATYTVTKVDKNMMTLTRDTGKRKFDHQYYLGPSSGYVGTATKAGEEEVKVGSKSFKCTIYEIKKEAEGKAGKLTQLTRVWKCVEVPFWAVKNSWSQTDGTGKPLGHVEELIGIDEIIKVGDKEYKCQVVRKTTEGLGVKNVETTWWCDDLPGRAAKKLTQVFMNDKEMKEAGTVEELVEFEKK